MELLKKHRNKIFQFLVDNGFNPGDFEISSNRIGFKIEHTDTGFYFLITADAGMFDYSFTMSPGFEKHQEIH